MTLVPTDQLLQLRRIGLYPTIDGRVVNVEASLLHHLRELPIANAVLQIPADAKQDEVGRKVSPFETVRHASFCAERICNRAILFLEAARK